MAYTQKPGRGNNAKTGYGVPAPFKQEDKYSGFGKDLSKGNAYEKWDTNNPNYKFREYNEKQAKQDSSAVAGKAIKFGVGKREAGKMGNEAANAVRKNMGNADLNVTVKTVPGGEEYSQKVKPGINPRTGAKVKVVPPMKQMGAIDKVVSKAKEIGGKIVKGIKTMDKALEGKSDTRSFNAKDTVLGRKATGARAGEKASPAKMKMGKKAPAKMKKC